VKPVADALAEGFKREAHPEAQLVLHVLDRDVFERISARSPEDHAPALESERKEHEHPRVFISYCHTSPEHEKWVESLGMFLRDNGVDTRLDIWHLRRGMDLPQFMTNELALAERVILVSDERYAEKADGRVGRVGWETMIVQGDMAKLPPESTKYLVIVRSQKIDDGLPLYLKTKFVIHWPGGIDHVGNRDILLRELYDVVRVPKIGAKPVYL
jgi:TIR domain